MMHLYSALLCIAVLSLLNHHQCAPVGGDLARTPGLHPHSLRECRGIYNDHRESGPRFNRWTEYRKGRYKTNKILSFLSMDYYTEQNYKCNTLYLPPFFMS